MPKRDGRALHHLKSSRTTTGRGIPRNDEGADGDLALRLTNSGLKLFAKYQNKWYIVGEYMKEAVLDEKRATHHQTQALSTAFFNQSGGMIMQKGSLIEFGGRSHNNTFGVNVSSTVTNETSNALVTVDSLNMLSMHAAGSGSFVRVPHAAGAFECKKIYFSDEYANVLGDTFIAGNSEDELIISVGGATMLHFIESTTNTMESQEIAEYLIRSGTTEDPILHLKNTTNDATGPTLKLNNAKAGGGNFGADDDVLGTISFDGEDDAGNAQQYANINSTIDVAANGQESGKLAIQVASNDGGLEDGLILTGGSLDTEVDVTIGTGSASITTIAGDLTINGDQIKTAGAIALNSGGAVTLDAHNGAFIANNAGTEFSATNSAYAGMILGYTRLQGDLTSSATFEIQDALTVEDDTHKVTFITPPSELVEIELSCFINVLSTDTNIDVGLSTADTSGYAAAAAHLEYDFGGVFLSDDEAIDAIHTVKFIVGASELNAVGVSNTFWIGFSTAGATKGAYVAYGLRAAVGLAYPPMVIKATALPATIYDGL